jgi:hypothetical protein
MPELGAPPADDVELVELEEELPVGRVAFRRFGFSFSLLVGDVGACDFAGAVPAPPASLLNWRSRSLTSKLIASGSRMPAVHVPLAVSKIATVATQSAAVDNHRVGHGRHMVGVGCQVSGVGRMRTIRLGLWCWLEGIARVM